MDLRFNTKKNMKEKKEEKVGQVGKVLVEGEYAVLEIEPKKAMKT